MFTRNRSTTEVNGGYRGIDLIEAFDKVLPLRGGIVTRLGISFLDGNKRKVVVESCNPFCTDCFYQSFVITEEKGADT